ncbi:3-isopropylmalate dehydratase small subunit [Vibrio hangzhouensis]|uniref:3-isopropylmalate dehydratase small subunit n=1 Tax=Vibrio hangzhouensis TaxID=462991 RepID=A0A1H5V145_9VIBR|nr:3-isopropylmalate dehydratase small subunit [Vibrio hangzhouensis]SEF81085.1 3-isopropylmalate dehydratase, small subunit [Vibrio hangzhouensis]
MDKFIKETGIAAPYLAHNIDTDVIMPKQFLKRIDRAGLAEGVLYDQRFLSEGVPNPEFILNQEDWQDSKFLVVGDNFGCGSSREYAVWGIQQLGIRAIVGTSFAGIFFDNCQRNGVLLISLSPTQRDEIGITVASAESHQIEIDLQQQTITTQAGKVYQFEIDPLRKEALLSGQDTIGETLTMKPLIDEFEKAHLAASPWLA